jgi:hypothetical protein
MERYPNIFEVIESGDFDLLIEVIDEAFKEAAREASARSHALGLEVADGRAAEDRRRKPITPLTEGPDDLSDVSA